MFSLIPTALAADPTPAAVKLVPSASPATTAPPLDKVLNSAGNSTITTLLLIAGAAAVIYIIYAGFLYITSNGSADKIKVGRAGLVNGAIGIAVVAALFLFIRFGSSIAHTVSRNIRGVDGDTSTTDINVGNGVTNEPSPTPVNETSLDMGPEGEVIGNGKACLTNNDCVSPSTCQSGQCVWPVITGGTSSGTPSEIGDGSIGTGCKQNSDCTSKACYIPPGESLGACSASASDPNIIKTIGATCDPNYNMCIGYLNCANVTSSDGQPYSCQPQTLNSGNANFMSCQGDTYPECPSAATGGLETYQWSFNPRTCQCEKENAAAETLSCWSLNSSNQWQYSGLPDSSGNCPTPPGLLGQPCDNGTCKSGLYCVNNICGQSPENVDPNINP